MRRNNFLKINNSVSLEFEWTNRQLFASLSHRKSAELRSFLLNLLTFLCYYCCHWFALEIGPKSSHTYAWRNQKLGRILWVPFGKVFAIPVYLINVIWSEKKTHTHTHFVFLSTVCWECVSQHFCLLIANAIMVSSCTFFSLRLFQNFHIFAFFVRSAFVIT